MASFTKDCTETQDFHTDLVVSVITDTLHAVTGLCPCSTLSQAAFTSDCKSPNISNDSLENPVQIQLMQHWRKVQGVERAEFNWVSSTGAGNVQTSGLPKSLPLRSQLESAPAQEAVQHCPKAFCLHTQPQLSAWSPSVSLHKSIYLLRRLCNIETLNMHQYFGFLALGSQERNKYSS